MGRFRVVFRKSVAKDLREIPNRDLKRILATIDSLAEEPRSSAVEKISGQEQYRARQGDYRLVLEIRDIDGLVIVVKVGHRREVCRPR